MSARRITLTIERVVVDGPVDRATLATALKAELATRIARDGAASLGAARALESASVRPGPVDGAPAIARAAVGALTR